jgi:hypothetical protein
MWGIRRGGHRREGVIGSRGRERLQEKWEWDFKERKDAAFGLGACKTLWKFERRMEVK